MDRIETYFEAVPWPILIFLPIAGIAVAVFTPRWYRLPLSLVLMIVWLTLAQLPELGLAQRVSKATSFGAFLLVAVAALLDPGPKRRLPPVVWMYPIMALLSLFFVLSVVDFQLAMVLRVQWFLLTLAALLVVRTITDSAALSRVITALAIGLVLANTLPLSALFFSSDNVMLRGLMRFAPYGSNPNQIGVLFSMAFALTLYAAVRTEKGALKLVYIATAATAAGMGLLTSSRSVAVTLTIPAIPVLVYLTKRPVLILVVASVVVVGILFTIDQVTDKNFSRLATLETDRFAVFREYLAIVAKRPWFGLLGTKNESYLAASSVGRHSHNAYIEALYVGGVSYAVPMFMLAAYSFVCCVRCWRKRGLTPYDPLAISVLSSFLIMMYVHGFVNDAIYYPTYFWAFLHVTLASFFVCAAKKVREIESCYRLSIGQS